MVSDDLFVVSLETVDKVIAVLKDAGRNDLIAEIEDDLFDAYEWAHEVYLECRL